MEGLLRSHEVHEYVIICFQGPTNQDMCFLDCTGLDRGRLLRASVMKHSVSTQKTTVEAFSTDLSRQNSTRRGRKQRSLGKPSDGSTRRNMPLANQWRFPRDGLNLTDQRVQSATRKARRRRTKLPAQSCHEAFEEGLHDGTLEAHGLENTRCNTHQGQAFFSGKHCNFSVGVTDANGFNQRKRCAMLLLVFRLKLIWRSHHTMATRCRLSDER